MLGVVMSRYLFETGPGSECEVERALALVSHRFPEIVVERLYTAHSGRGGVVWVCRAPNAAQMRRWAQAGRLRLSHLREVDVIGPGNDSATTTERKEQLP
jgi:hypothetical protein